MVGVGGRSKACATCRKRRVKCDELKPTCQRCAKAKVACGGYRGLAVIQYDGRSQQAKSSRIPSPNVVKPEDDVVELPQQAMVRIKGSNALQWEAGTTSDFSLGATICTPVDDIYVAYTMTHLLRGADEAARLRGVERPLSDKCFIALATTYFGTQHHEKIISEYGLQRYGRALKDVNRALGDERRVVGYDLMESVVIMALFEFLISNSETGWIGHSQGLERLLQLHGPNSFSLPILIIFEKSRTSVIFAALATHTPTILSSPEWKTLPWSAFPDRKDDVQFLLDVLVDCPQLLVTKDQLAIITNHEERIPGYRAFLLNTMELLDKLEQWRYGWMSRHEDFAVEIPAPESTPHFMSPNNKRIPLWPTILQYKSYEQANIYALYNATLIFLLRQVEEIIYVTPGLASLPIVETCPSKLYTAGIEICRSVDYHLEGMRDGVGSFGILYPLRMAYDAVGRHDELVGAWLKNVLKKIKESTGRWAIAGYLLNINPPQDETLS